MRYCTAKRILLAMFAVLSLLVVAAPARAERPGSGQFDDAATKRLSPAALEPLVAGIALYPDPLVKDILGAATTPLALRQATGARGSANAPRASWSASVRALEAYPEILEQLQQHRLLTVRLGAAYRQQPNDVWAAVERVRTKVDALVPSPSATANPADPAPEFVYANSAGSVMGRLLTPAAVAELQHIYAEDSNPIAGEGEVNIDTNATIPRAGDGQIENAPRNSQLTPERKLAAPSSPAARYSELNQQQVSLANRAMSQSWGQLDSQLATKKPAAKDAAGSRGNGNRTPRGRR
jgi:hypothetical protein